MNESGGLSVAQIYQAAHKGVVEITIELNGGGAQGSGWVYDSAGHVVTNDHVVDGASSIEVTFSDGSSYPATLVGNDPSTDLAVIKVDAPASKLHPLTVGDSAQLSLATRSSRSARPLGSKRP